MRRRNVVGLAAAALALPFTLFAQQPGRTYRLGVFLFRQNSTARAHLAVLRERLTQLGFAEGRNLQIVQAYSSNDPDVRSENVRKLVRAEPDAILSFGSSITRAVHAAAGRIPVIFTIVGDAVGYGLVAELARPGRNLTGVTTLQSELTLKRLELLREVLPKARRVIFAGALKDVTYVANESVYRHTAARLGYELVGAELSGGGFVAAVTQAMQDGADAVFVYQPVSFLFEQDEPRELVRFATARRIPVFFAESELVALGGLLSYSQDFLDETRRAADLIAKVLRGANAGDLPIEQTSRFELVVNLKVARALGIAVPQSVLVRADRLIE